jgi:hypothetical protein
VKAVEKKACAARVDERRTESFEGFGSGSADTAEIFELGLGDFSGFARGRVAEVKLGVVEAKRLAAEGGRVAFAAVRQDVAAFDDIGHECPPWGCPPYSAGKYSSLSGMAAGRPSRYSQEMT